MRDFDINNYFEPQSSVELFLLTRDVTRVFFATFLLHCAIIGPLRINMGIDDKKKIFKMVIINCMISNP